MSTSIVPGSPTTAAFAYPAGFTAAGVACGIKPSGEGDLAMIHCAAAVTPA